MLFKLLIQFAAPCILFLHVQAAVLGFVGSPWTLATYIIEGKSSIHYKTIKTMLYKAPDLIDALLSHLSDQIATYIGFQIDSGAHCVQLFDSWGGQLPPHVSSIVLVLLLFPALLSLFS